MTVYVIVQLKMTDRASYDRYQARFFDVFKKFSGRLLSADEHPAVIEGTWDRDKLVLMSFTNEAAFRAWADSPEYLEISWRRDSRRRALSSREAPAPTEAKKQARSNASLLSIFQNEIAADAFSPMTVMMVAAPPVPPMMVVMPPMPMHLGGHLLPGILLHRRCRARIDQRRRLCTLHRSRDKKQCADSRKTQNFKTQNFRSVHPNSPSHAISRQRRAAIP
jgi:uncharacterized protein (DUF1330 family)